MLSASAGAIEAFSVLELGAFAGAQTGNIVLGAIAASEGHWHEASRYLWPLLAFVAGVMAAQTLLIAPATRIARRPYRTLLALEIVALVVVAAVLDSVPDVVASVVITVAVAAQASTFRTVVDIGYNSAFTTGNLMNALVAAHAALARRDREQAIHSRRIALVIGAYAGGAIAGAAATRGLSQGGILLAAAGLALALALFVRDEQRHRQTRPE